MQTEIISVAEHFLNLHEIKSNAVWADPHSSKASEKSKEISDLMKQCGWQEGWPYCYDGNVQILTEIGWINFKDLTEEHGRVAQVSDDHEISFCYPLDYIHKKHTGKIADIETQSVNIITDDGHKFYGKWNQSNYQLRRIDSIGDSLSIPNCTRNSQQNEWSDEQIKFIAAFIADGTIKHNRPNQIHFGVSKERKIESLSNFDFHRKVRQSFIKENSSLAQTIFTFWAPDYFDKVFTNYKEISWKWALSLSKEQCRLFIDTYTFYDGYTRGASSNVITTARKQNADILAAMSTFAGRKTKYRETKSTSGYSKGNTMYEIRFSNDKHRYLKGKSVKFRHVKDYDLYCVTVPKGKILIRDFDGNIFGCGNCSAFTEAVWRTAYKNAGASQELLKRIDKLLCPHVMTTVGNIGNLITKIPTPGSIFFLQKGSSSSGHAGIVYRTDAKLIYTIEGNTSPTAGSAEADREGDGIYRKTRKLSFVRNPKGLWLRGFLNPLELC